MLVAAQCVPVGRRRVEPACVGGVVGREDRLASDLFAHPSPGGACGGFLPTVRWPELHALSTG